MPGHIPWPVHRVATSGVYQDSLHTILSAWSLADVLDAHAVVEALEEARAAAEKGARS